MDRTTGEGYATVGGKRRFTDGPPGTVLNAEWLNAVQEEILAVIEGAGMTPSATDLTQLRQAVQGFSNSAGLRYGADTGAADAYVVSTTPAVTAYADGIALLFKATNSNTGASTINVNSLGVKDVVGLDGAALTAGMIRSGTIHMIVYSTSSGKFMLNNKAV